MQQQKTAAFLSGWRTIWLCHFCLCCHLAGGGWGWDLGPLYLCTVTDPYLVFTDFTLSDIQPEIGSIRFYHPLQGCEENLLMSKSVKFPICNINDISCRWTEEIFWSGGIKKNKQPRVIWEQGCVYRGDTHDRVQGSLTLDNLSPQSSPHKSRLSLHLLNR